MCSVSAVVHLYRDRPLDLVARQLDKTWALLYGYEPPSALSFYIEKYYVPFFSFPWITWPMILGFGIVGAIELWKNRAAAIPLFAYLVLYGAGTVAFYVVDRFRVPLAPVLAVLAGVGAAAVIQACHKRRWVRAGAMAVVALAITVTVWPRESDDLQPTDYRNLVRFELIKQQPDQARSLIGDGKARAELALARRESAYDHYRLARLLFTAGDPLDQVRAELDRAGKLGPPQWLHALIVDLGAACNEQQQAGDPKTLGFRL